MNCLPLIALLFSLLLGSCANSPTSTSVPTQQVAAPTQDEQTQLEQLLQKVYEWHETKSQQHDFEPLADRKNEKYIGLDQSLHQQRLAELAETNFFAERFLTDYNVLGLAIDEGLKTGKLLWDVGDMPPFGNGANPWCNCQDSPENYWHTLTITKMNLEGDTASVTWTWDSDFEYRTDAVRENNRWKISYLEGFDRKLFLADF